MNQKVNLLIGELFICMMQEIVENEQRNLIFEGDLLEINPDNYSAVQRKRGYLFNDGVMLASWVTNR